MNLPCAACLCYLLSSCGAPKASQDAAISCCDAGVALDAGPSCCDAAGLIDASPDGETFDASPLVDAGEVDAGGTISIDAAPVDAALTSCSQGGNGAANFSEHLIDGNFVHGQGVEIVDVNRDGLNDVLVAFSLTDSVHLYINECESWQLVRITPSNRLVATDVASGDFDGDGDLDVVAVELFARAGGLGSVRWYENPGAMTNNWIEHNITTLSSARRVQVAELSGDGRPDLIVGTAGSGPGVQWFRNTGGSFEGPMAVDGSLRNVQSLLIHDVDGDGSLDVIASAVDSAEIAWYESDRSAGQEVNSISFSKHTIEGTAGSYGIALGNFDADANLELAAGTARGIEIYDPPANPAGAWSRTTITANYAGDSDVYLFAGPLNADASDDIVVVSGSSAAASVFLRSGENFVTSEMTSGYTGLNAIAGGDLDGDGDLDLLTSTYANGASDRISWWENLP